ncbi:MAG: hypothetical protein QOC92_2792 [Acidimicrobiaceae bacterium]|jgi:alkanesulfonate monooxygenase SsuD/methylene tetrahydromethanopterin reductase-like flavin-dependent oxidoreductase (luciferase family)
MRFDLRAPTNGASPATLYAAALDMVEWSESRGCALVVLSEHHASPDGYLPTPIVVAAAMAARTTAAQFMIGAAILPLYEPVRLAEEMVVLDIISRGRVSYVFGLGYRPEEYSMFGVATTDRAGRTEDNLAVVLEALRGEPFDHGGRRIWVTPKPFTDGGPRIAYGGGSVAAARRAARFGLDFLAQTNRPGLEEAYHDEAARAGRTPGHLMLPSPGDPMTVFVADDVDCAWDEVGPYLLHDAVTYAEWNDDAEIASISHGKTVDELRVEGGAHRIFTVDEAVEHIRAKGILPLHPLCGGLPPDLAWPYLRRVAEEVLPAAQ